MSKITIDLDKLMEQAEPQRVESVDSLLLQQRLSRNIGAAQVIIVDLAATIIENEVETTAPTPRTLRLKVNDVIAFSDASQLHIRVLAPSGSCEDLTIDAYYGLLGAISNI